MATWRGAALGAFLLVGWAGGPLRAASVPGVIGYQGRLTVNATNFTGNAWFKFALVDGGGTTTLWSHNGTSIGGETPADPPVVLAVQRGVFSVQLGDSSVAGMSQPIAATVFTNEAVFLRVWVHDGSHGWQRLDPDRRLVAVGYAMAAETVVGPVPAAQLTGALPAAAVEAALPSGFTVVSPSAQDPALLAKGYLPVMTVPAPPWGSSSAANAPSARVGHSAIWDGQRFIVWGGGQSSAPPLGSVFRTGGMYWPELDAWESTSTLDAPEARSGHTAVWSGTEMLIWGGEGAAGLLNTGGRFDPALQQWRPINPTGAPSARSGHVAVWTGSRMLIWGGWNNGGVLGDGALYDPVADQWTALNLPNPPTPRHGATVVSAGDRALIWGGRGELGNLDSGAQLLFASGLPTQWLPTSQVATPAARRWHSAVWTGQRMIVWGGEAGGIPLADGGSYDPGSDEWNVLASEQAPAARLLHASVWTGQEMLVLGGTGDTSELASGGAYDPATDRWRSLTGAGNPLARSSVGAAWTGSQVLVFGGISGGPPVAALQSLVPQLPWHFYRKP